MLDGGVYMARSDLLIDLVQAGIRNDQKLFRQIVEALAAEERAKQHHILADRLASQLRENGRTSHRSPNHLDEQLRDLLFQLAPQRSLADLILPDTVSRAISEVVEEHRRGELLRSYNLEPRHRILLAGPPGNGKTALAEAVANSVMVPLIVVRYEGIIGSYLGETASRLRKVFDFVRSIPCVLFFDEFDVLGKERGDVHETGEIKRVVSSLLLQIDELPSYVIVVTATNHAELLDKAVWRRFQLRLHLPMPEKLQIEDWLRRFENRNHVSLGVELSEVVDELGTLSFAELEDFGSDILRHYVLSLPRANMKRIVRQRLVQWNHRYSLDGSRTD